MGYQEDTILKWKSWIEKINQDLTEQAIFNQVFFEVGKIVEDGNVNPYGNVFIDMLITTFFSNFTMTIRRQVKNDDNSISLIRLMTQMSKEPNLNSWFPNTTIDQSQIIQDIEQLQIQSNKFEEFGDKRIAHHDKGFKEFKCIFDETNVLLDAMIKMKNQYYIILTGVIQTGIPPLGDWKRIFRKAWITDPSAVREADDL